MDLTVEDVAQILHLSEHSVEKLAKESRIPAYQLQNHFRFDRIEIEQWMMEHHQAIFDDEETDALPTSPGWNQFALLRAIHRGGISEDRGGDDKAAIIKRVMENLSTQHHFDAEVVTSLLFDREKLMPTSLARGVAVPHTRDFLMEGPYDIIHLVYLQEPIDWGALDEEPVHTLFFLFACDDKRHLHLLAKIAHLVSQSSLIERLKQRPAASLLLDELRTWESGTRQ